MIITDKHPMASEVMVLDINNELIKYVKEYNTETKEAVMYNVRNGQVKLEKKYITGIKGGRIPVTETRILEGSRLVMKTEEGYRELTKEDLDRIEFFEYHNKPTTCKCGVCQDQEKNKDLYDQHDRMLDDLPEEMAKVNTLVCGCHGTCEGHIQRDGTRYIDPAQRYKQSSKG